jgi:hypothetical protein
MPRRFLPFIALTLAAGAAMLSGCGGKSYASEDEYVSSRAQDLGIGQNDGDWVQGLGENHFRRWNLSSGQVVIDEIPPNAPERIIDSRLFDSGGDADAWVGRKTSEGQPPQQTIEQYRESRAQELQAQSGEFLTEGPDAAYYLWSLPDGTFMRDKVVLDGKGVAKAESTPFATKEQALADIVPPRSENAAEYISKRQAELKAKSLDWAEKTSAFQIFAFRMPDDSVMLDVVKAEYDPLTGPIVAKRMPFPALDEAVGYVATQMQDEHAMWSSVTQYRRSGWIPVGFVVLIVFFVLYNINRAKREKGATIRRIAGLDQIDEAVGRATEIARPVLMVPGLGTLNGITVQALTIFAYVIRTAARFGTPIRLLNADASVYAVAQEIARDVYMSEGVPEQYDPTSVSFVSDRQFAFAAGVAGTIQREKVAATFFFGDFFAESMIFAENANMVGAIQVAATTQFTQTPFFIAACDYVLLGDEFYAASAYLGRQPVLIGSLIGVDISKMVVMAVVILGVIIHSVQTMRPVDLGTLPAETSAEWTKNHQQYLDWRKDDLLYKRLVKVKRD